MNVLIYPLRNIAKKFGVSLRAMYDFTDLTTGEKRPGRLGELAKLGICFKTRIGKYRSRPVWAMWEHHAEMFTQLKAKKGEMLTSSKDREI